jgi:hypothetical protein
MPKNPNAVNLGRMGGKAKASRMTATERSQAMSDAVSAYWAGMTPEERTAELKRRAQVRKDRKEAK